jgi:N-acetylglutamate synthase-like GNAT family acetyltransferase
MISLRSAQAADEKPIKRLVRSSGINPTNLKWPHFTIAHNEMGEMVGCAQLKQLSNNEVTELASMVVVPEYRQKGIARLLIEHLLDQHPGTLYLMCRAPLRPFYEKFDFEVALDDSLPGYFKRRKRLMNVFQWILRSDDAIGYIMVRRQEQDQPK